MNKRKIVCLCGSTRFTHEFKEIRRAETLNGNIVIGPEVDMNEDYFRRDFKPAERKRIKAELDRLHLDKIDLADEVYIVNAAGYIGESTRKELDYALSKGKPVRYLTDPLFGELTAP